MRSKQDGLRGSTALLALPNSELIALSHVLCADDLSPSMGSLCRSPWAADHFLWALMFVMSLPRLVRRL